MGTAQNVKMDNRTVYFAALKKKKQQGMNKTLHKNTHSMPHMVLVHYLFTFAHYLTLFCIWPSFLKETAS